MILRRWWSRDWWIKNKKVSTLSKRDGDSPMKRIHYGFKLKASMEKVLSAGTLMEKYLAAFTARGLAYQEFGFKWSHWPLSNLVWVQ